MSEAREVAEPVQVGGTMQGENYPTRVSSSRHHATLVNGKGLHFKGKAAPSSLQGALQPSTIRCSGPGSAVFESFNFIKNERSSLQSTEDN